MQNEFRERQRRNVNNMRMVKDITMAVLILGMAVVLFFGPSWGIPIDLDDLLRMSLAGLFTLYGGFRLYRGIKRDY
jgi:uncharacterized membrane protein